jgi:hypothetical protein
MDPVGADRVSQRHAHVQRNRSIWYPVGTDGFTSRVMPLCMDSFVSLILATRNPDGADRVPNLNAISLKFFQINFCVSYISLISCLRL